MQLLQSIRNYAERYPEQIAFVSEEKELSYHDLWKRSDQLAVYIHNQTLTSQSPIMVYGHMEPEMLVAFLGCVKAGHPYIPVDVSIPTERIIKIMESSQAEMLINVSNLPLSDEMKSILTLNQDYFDSVLESDDSIDSQYWVKENDTFYIIYTSGSTGNPKGVQISVNNLQSFVDWMMDESPISVRQKFLNQAPFSFDLSVMDVYPSLATGGTILAITKEMIAKPKLLFAELAQSHIQVWTSTPSFAEICLMNPEFSQEMIPELKVFLFCGEVLSSQTARQLLERFPNARIYNMYGPTEATVAVTKLEVTEDILDACPTLPVGVCKSDSRVLIVNEVGEQVPDGEKGEIIIVGPSVSKGYLGEKQLTEKAFFLYEGEMAYRTGDAGYKENDQLFYKGRLDFQIKLHGYRMELEEIEYHMEKSQYVHKAVTIPISGANDDKIEYLLAVIIPTEHSFEKEYQLTSAIKKELQEILPAYMIPRKFTYTNELPITPNGKIDRKSLKAEVLA